MTALPPQAVEAIFSTFAKRNPTPTTELNYQSAFELLIAVILSAQATDASVNRATAPLFEKANTPEALLALGEEGLIDHIRSIGLFRSKARHIIATCQRLIDHHRGQVPDNRPDLEALPGVGRKTANVVLNTVFGQPTMAVDTHIFRVANRIGLAAGKTPLAVERQLLACIPKAYQRHAHHWLILHGRYTCKARQPDCGHCPIQNWCAYRG